MKPKRTSPELKEAIKIRDQENVKCVEPLIQKDDIIEDLDGVSTKYNNLSDYLLAVICGVMSI